MLFGRIAAGVCALSDPARSMPTPLQLEIDDASLHGSQLLSISPNRSEPWLRAHAMWMEALMAANSEPASLPSAGMPGMLNVNMNGGRLTASERCRTGPVLPTRSLQSDGQAHRVVHGQPSE